MKKKDVSCLMKSCEEETLDSMIIGWGIRSMKVKSIDTSE